MKRTPFLLLLLIFGLLSVNQSCADKPEKDTPQEKTYPIALVKTSFGDMYFWLYDETPNHKAKFIELANTKHYNQFTFNRVLKNFVVQGGCPDSVQYFEGSPYLLDPEFVDSLKHTYGALGMGRDDNLKKQSNACQFYIVNKEVGLPSLDGNYMIFGKILKGQDVLEIIEKVPTDANDQPQTPIPLDVSIVMMTKLELSDSLGLVLME